MSAEWPKGNFRMKPLAVELDQYVGDLKRKGLTIYLEPKFKPEPYTTTPALIRLRHAELVREVAALYLAAGAEIEFLGGTNLLFDLTATLNTASGKKETVAVWVKANSRPLDVKAVRTRHFELWFSRVKEKNEPTARCLLH
jgi:hypothetical protein